ncbi:neuropeptide F receptor [Coccinella septempunctata]|uniref:neuropeptide F receptor n=1 Tax=Coccinella septempunctata TaxID=41139 RepID=UPI001D08D071|nr:neuropeptide F receptor [Coccinella septempunctata]
MKTYQIAQSSAMSNESYYKELEEINADRIVNESKLLLEKYVRNRAIDEPAYTTLIVMYGILIVVGALGNTLVIISVVRKAAMRTPRNMFILNLAISDLLLCTITMPLTLMEILTKYFPLGDNEFVCKIIGTLQAMSTFVSTISITAIALDRYQVIVYPTKVSLQIYGAGVVLLLIWIVALILALPLFIYKKLEHQNITLTDDIDGLNFCIENWPNEHGRAYYSIFSLTFLYILPITIITVVYAQISYKLRYRFNRGFTNEENPQNNRRQLRGRKLHKTNLLLTAISLVFCISWMPLNLFNLIADLHSNSQDINFTSQKMIVAYAMCHLMGMSSACSNPVLYGCLNDNFMKEFKDILGIAACQKNKGGDSNNRQSKRSVKRDGKGELMTAATDYQQCNTHKPNANYLSIPRQYIEESPML